MVYSKSHMYSQHVTFVIYAANCGHAQEMILSLGWVLAKCAVDIKCVWPD